MKPTAEISLPVYAALHGGREYGRVRFAFNPLAGHPLSSDLRAQKKLFVDVWLACEHSREHNERIYPWSLRHEVAMDLIVVSDWARKFRQQSPDRYYDDRHCYALIQKMFCEIVKKPPGEAPSFELALGLECDRNQEEQRLLREYNVDCGRGGFRRSFAALLESWGLKEPPPVPKIGREWEYQCFLAHNRQMEVLVRWFSGHTEEINQYCNGKPLIPGVR